MSFVPLLFIPPSKRRARMDHIKVTFFMIVTDPDAVIADYAVKSYAKIADVSFRLRIYSNWLSAFLKDRYFDRWRKFPFVEIVDPDWHVDDKKPSDPSLEGPFERCDTIWDRELKQIDTPYHATVDADFEILDPRFVPVMLEQLDTNPKLIAMSTDYTPTVANHYDSYSNDVICLIERWHTWFCIYKREALHYPVPHAYRQEISGGSRIAWDTSGYFQSILKGSYGFELAALDPKYRPCFIHYGAFSKNRNITESNVGHYRLLQIIRRRGVFGVDAGFRGSIDQIIKKSGNLINRLCFGHIDRSKYWPGWGQ
jgi:hypothetical protein